MAFIGFLVILSIIGSFIGLIGLIITSTLSMFAKILLFSIVAFIYACILAAISGAMKG